MRNGGSWGNRAADTVNKTSSGFWVFQNYQSTYEAQIVTVVIQNKSLLLLPPPPLQ